MLLFVDFVFVFIIGACIGSFLNVCVYRLPFEKSLLWPASCCGNCLQPIRWYDNIPLVSYWRLGGKCRLCHATFSMRYFFVELFTALAFVGLFYLEAVRNILGIEFIAKHQNDIAQGFVPFPVWMLLIYHATLLSFLIVASLVDLDHMEIPLPITITGTIFGLVGSLFVPWPFPNGIEAIPRANGPGVANIPIAPGVFPWPIWHPLQLPSWLPPGSWQLGLATSLAGVLAGMLVLRAVRFLFGVGRGKEGLGLGDADLMMMAGSFLGWQPILIAFFVSVVPGLVLGVAQLFRRGDQTLPFAPALAIGVMITLLCWRWLLGPQYRELFFEPLILGIMFGGGSVLLLLVSFVLRLFRGKPSTEEKT
jgi:leader peptidase (prepilin peptidase)/N-methyltransferase